MNRRSLLLLPGLALPGLAASPLLAQTDSAADWVIEDQPAKNQHAKSQPSRLRISYRTQPFTALHYGKEWDKSFLYPILAADGTELSRGWPVAPRPDDAQDHAWHRGIWWGHGDINGEDFWREKTDAKTGRRSTATIPTTFAKANIRSDGSLSIDAQHTLLSSSGATLSTLSTRWILRQAKDVRSIDFRLDLNASNQLRFGDTEDGGFAFRLREEFREDRGALLSNASGQTGAQAIWGKPSPWTDYSARIGAKTYGVAILAHPSNLRHPSGWHARNYGLNSANPFAESGFREEKGGQKGAYILYPQQTLSLRYRILIHSGDAAQAEIGQQYDRYRKEQL